MPAISVGSVEVDIVPNARGIQAQLRAALVPAASTVGDEVGRIIGRRMAAHITAAVRDGVTAGGRTAQAPAARQGQQTGSTFARSLKAQLQAALATLPEIRLRADSSDAQRELADIQARMRALSDARLGIDVDAATARAAMEQLQARLDRLSASDADIQVRVDAAAASAQLAAFNAQVNRLDGRTARVDVDTRSAAANFHMLTSAAIMFGPAIIPALPVVAAGLGAVAAAATAAAVGIGAIALVAAPAFMQIGKVLQAQKAAQDAATQATLQGGQASNQAAQRSLQMASAQQSLASAHRNAARPAGSAGQGVADAVRGAAEANERAADQVKQAKRGLADAVQQAADRQRSSAEQIRSAEESLADAQRSARQAQQDLTQARADAARQLEDLESRLANAALSEQDAVLAVQEAHARLVRMREQGESASYLDQQRAQLAYDQAVQRLEDQRTETKRLTAEKKKADKAGVEGSDLVLDAQERLQEAERGVADQQKALSKARSDAARQAVQSQRDIAEAQERVAESQRNVTRTQEDGARSVARAQEQLAQAQQSAADSIASAQRQIASASLSAAGGVDQAALAQQKYQDELAKLTPSARDTMNAFLDLKDAFSAWSRALQPAVMPIFTRALEGIKNSLPGLTPFVLEAADAIKGLQDRASEGFKKPWWKEFKQDLEGSIKPAIEGLGISFGNIFKGMAGVMQAFFPHMDSISERMQRLTGRFANWGKNLKGSPEFERFLSYSSEHAPLLADTLGKIGTAFLDIGQALSPVSGPMLELLGGMASAVSTIATKAPELVIALWGLWAATRAWQLALVLWAGAMWLASIAMAAFNLVSKAGPWGWIALAVIAVVGIVILLWQKCEWFRDAVKAVWSAIRTAAIAVKDWFAGPFARFWAKTFPGYFKTGWDWIKANILYPIRDFFTKTVPGWARSLGSRVTAQWMGMVEGLFDGWDWVKRHVLYPIRDFFTKTVPGWGTTLKNRLVGAFEAASKGIEIAFKAVRAATRKPIQYVVDVVYNNGIRGVWNTVAGAFGAPKLARYKFASGGIMPGYTPGRDVHRFVSPTGGRLELSGGEAIMRPEFTRAVGSGFVGTMNSIAKSSGAQGVKAALAPMLGGNPNTSTDTSLRYAGGGTVQRFADGGIFGWIKDRASDAVGAGSAAWNKVKEGASWLGDTLEASARAGVRNVVDPLLKKFHGMDTGFGKMLRRIPDRIIDALFGYSKEADKRGAGGIGGPRISAALKWAKTQHGKPYQWGGNGNPSWDCSGFMSAIESVIRGQKPHRRWSTHAFKGGTPPGWVKNGSSAFRVGITHAGVGHTAGTIGRTKVESRGGDGVVVGSRARGYNDRLFSSWYGFEPGKYDNGGMLQPGFNLAYNGTGRPEPVLTGAQFNALARGGGELGDLQVSVYVGDQQITDIARAEVRTAQGELIQVLNAV